METFTTKVMVTVYQKQYIQQFKNKSKNNFFLREALINFNRF